MSRVTIRKRNISKGRQSLYLDIYPAIPNPATGKLQRKYYLKIFLYEKPKTRIEREHNSETLSLAEHIRAKYQLDVQAHKYDFISEKRMQANFVELFQAEAEKRYGDFNWKMSVAYFVAFAGENFPLSYLNETFCEEYAAFLLSSPGVGRNKRKIKTNTAVSYFSRFKAALKVAYKKRFLPIDLASIVDSLSPEKTHREFLQMHEVENLAIADCDSPIVKKAGLFSALTGFRYSDIETLLWKEIRGIQGDYYIQYTQEKSDNPEYFPISDQTVALLGTRGESSERVFVGLKYENVVKYLPQWLKAAGIDRHITFHGFRHTFATLQIASGTSIYTVSKLLGHKNLQTTEIYAKIVDSLKREASEKINIKALQVALVSEIPSPRDADDLNVIPEFL